MKPPFLRTNYNYDLNKAGDETAIACKDPSLTQQQFLEESDINFIADKFGLTGELPQVLDLPQYGDFTGIFDFQSAQNAVVEANIQFLTLPAKLRARFDNDPNKLLHFLADPENRKEAEFLGLVNKPENDNGPPRTEAPATRTEEATGARGAQADTRTPQGTQKPGPEAGKGGGS